MVIIRPTSLSVRGRSFRIETIDVGGSRTQAQTPSTAGSEGPAVGRR